MLLMVRMIMGIFTFFIYRNDRFYGGKQMSRSIIADYIDKEYRLKQSYQKKQRQNCKDKKCDECKYFNICVERVGGT